MKMESNARRASGALNMASTGRLKKVKKGHDFEIARIIRKAAKQSAAEGRPRSAFDALATLAAIDAKRLKLIADIFAALRPFAPAQSSDAKSPKSSLTKQESVNLIRMRLGLDPKPDYLKNSALGRGRLRHAAAEAAAVKPFKPPPSKRRMRKQSSKPSNVIAIGGDRASRIQRAIDKYLPVVTEGGDPKSAS